MKRWARAWAALLVVALASTRGATARAQADFANVATESFWGTSGPSEVPPPLSPAEEARRAYTIATRNAEEARLAQERGAFYSPVDGLWDVHVRCTPVCGVTHVLVNVGPSPTVADLTSALRTAKPRLVGARPERGLGAAPVRDAAGVVWFSRSVHRGFPCDCAVGVVTHSGRSVFFESLEGAEALPTEARYTRGEARDAALRQLVDPRLEAEPEQPMMIVSAGNRAHLVHRFLFQLDGKPHTVDVDNETLEVVRVRPVPVAPFMKYARSWESAR